MIAKHKADTETKLAGIVIKCKNYEAHSAHSTHQHIERMSTQLKEFQHKLESRTTAQGSTLDATAAQGADDSTRMSDQHKDTETKLAKIMTKCAKMIDQHKADMGTMLAEMAVRTTAQESTVERQIGSIAHLDAYVKQNEAAMEHLRDQSDKINTAIAELQTFQSLLESEEGGWEASLEAVWDQLEDNEKSCNAIRHEWDEFEEGCKANVGTLKSDIAEGFRLFSRRMASIEQQVGMRSAPQSETEQEEQQAAQEPQQKPKRTRRKPKGR